MSNQSKRRTNPDTARSRLLVLAAVIAIFVLGSVIFVVIRACGGDEPAPQLKTTTLSMAGTDSDLLAATFKAASGQSRLPLRN